jgi:hypothetical protein
MSISMYGTDLGRLELTDEIEARIRLTMQELAALKRVAASVRDEGRRSGGTRGGELMMMAETLGEVIGRIETRAYRRYQ